MNQLRFIGNFDDDELEEFMEPLRYYPFGIEGEFWENDIFSSDIKSASQDGFFDTHIPIYPYTHIVDIYDIYVIRQQTIAIWVSKKPS